MQCSVKTRSGNKRIDQKGKQKTLLGVEFKQIQVEKEGGQYGRWVVYRMVQGLGCGDQQLTEERKV